MCNGRPWSPKDFNSLLGAYCILTCPLSPQLLQLSPPPIPAPGTAASVAAHWAADGLHALAQLPAQCAAAAHAAHVPCDLPALLAAVGPAGWSEPRFHHP